MATFMQRGCVKVAMLQSRGRVTRPVVDGASSWGHRALHLDPEVAMSAEWNFMDPASRSNLMRTVRAEAAAFFELVANTEWEAPTACEKWQARDHIGAKIEVTEGYFV